MLRFFFYILKDIWFVIRPIRYILIFLTIGFIILTVPDQARDIFVAFTESAARKSCFYFIMFSMVAIPTWSFSVWYSTRVVLQLTEVESDPAHEHRIRMYIKWVPRLLGLFPYLFAIRGFMKIDARWEYPAFFLFLAACYLLIVHYRQSLLQLLLSNRFVHIPVEQVYKYFPILVWDDETRFQRRIISWWEFPRWTLTVAVVLSVGLFLLFTFSPRFSQLVGASTIIVIAISTWTLVGMVLSYLDYTYKFPFFVSLLLCAAIFSFFNDNHAIRTVNTSVTTSRPADIVHFRHWITRRDTGRKVIPVIILAAEGGGIRSAYWTASVLARLQSKNPAFGEHLFAISGVSGGSLGAVVFGALYKDKVLTRRDTSLLPSVKRVLSKDFLAPLTGALLYPDLLQRLSPFPIHAADRARWLEDAWKDAYTRETGLHTFDSAFLSLWQHGDSLRMPGMLLNGTCVETGQKVIISNMAISQRFFKDAIDLQQLAGKHIPLKTAASISARFPVVTPAATIYSNGKKWGHVVDGGYFENTGLMTAMQVLHLIQMNLDTTSVHHRKIKPIIVYVKNAASETTTVRPMNFLYEARTPLTAFLNAWSRTGIATAHSVENAVERLNRKVEFITFELNVGRDEIVPLGWFLSEKAQFYIDREVYKLGNPGFVPRTRVDTTNQRAFMLLDSLLKK